MNNSEQIFLVNGFTK